MTHPKPDPDRSPPPDVDEVIRHTDSGAGTSQAEPWKPNVSPPEDEPDDAAET
jgi:hypothetical protein